MRMTEDDKGDIWIDFLWYFSLLLIVNMEYDVLASEKILRDPEIDISDLAM